MTSLFTLCAQRRKTKFCLVYFNRVLESRRGGGTLCYVEIVLCTATLMRYTVRCLCIHILLVLACERGLANTMTAQALDILGTDRAVVLVIVDELVVRVGRVASDLNDSVDLVIRAAIGAHHFWKCCKGNLAEIRLEVHKLRHTIYMYISIGLVSPPL